MSNDKFVPKWFRESAGSYTLRLSCKPWYAECGVRKHDTCPRSTPWIADIDEQLLCDKEGATRYFRTAKSAQAAVAKEARSALTEMARQLKAVQK